MYIERERERKKEREFSNEKKGFSYHFTDFFFSKEPNQKLVLFRFSISDCKIILCQERVRYPRKLHFSTQRQTIQELIMINMQKMSGNFRKNKFSTHVDFEVCFGEGNDVVFLYEKTIHHHHRWTT